MSTEEETNKGISMMKKILALLFAVFVYAFSVAFPFWRVYQMNVSLNRQIDATGINGILTVSSIVFAFSTFELGRRTAKQWLVLVSMFFVQVFILALVGTSYFVNYLKFGYLTVETMTLATTSLYINLFSWLLFRLIRGVLWGEE